MPNPAPPLCKYVPNGEQYICEFCGDRTRHARLKRVCPTKRNTAGVGAVGRYMVSSAKWAASGFKTRSDDEVAAIIEICRACPEYTPRGDDIGSCRVCQCWLSKMGGLTNKLRRATESCPKEKW